MDSINYDSSIALRGTQVATSSLTPNHPLLMELKSHFLYLSQPLKLVHYTGSKMSTANK